jgi:hypothetical protein
MPRQLNVPDDVNDPTACPSSRTRGKVRDRTRETTCIRVVTTNMTDSVTATREILVAAWAPVPGVVSTGSSERSSADRARYIRRSWPHCDIWLGCCHSEDFMALLTSCRTEVIVVVEEYIGACRLSRLGSSDGIPRERSNNTIGPTLDGVGVVWRLNNGPIHSDLIVHGSLKKTLHCCCGDHK